MGGTDILQEPPLPRRKMALTPRPERGGSPTGAEQGPVQAMFSPSPVVRQEKPSSLSTHVQGTEESGSDKGGEPEDRRSLKEERPLVRVGDQGGAGPLRGLAGQR